ncbi:hypothetical protein [Marinicella sp. W31]|uniref:hypothetical protein n=1 Tax=Marinicella sp. W31 TaxID=3023713 RepID=UPI003757AC38
MKKSHQVCLWAAFLGAVATSFAQEKYEENYMAEFRGGEPVGEITDGTAVFSYNAGGFASFEGARTDFEIGGTDMTWSIWWYYRIDGDTQEVKFPQPDSATYVGNTATLTWADVDGRGLFSAELVHVLDEESTSGATLTNTMTLTNISLATVDINLFQYADFDVAGASNDEASLNNDPDYIALTDNATANSINTAEIRAAGNTNYQVTVYSTTDPLVLRAFLNDTALNDLDNTGLPFGPADFTGAFQWDTIIPLDGSYAVETTYAIGDTCAPQPIDPITVDPDVLFSDGFDLGPAVPCAPQ